MSNYNLTFLSSLEATEECNGTCNGTGVLTNNSSGQNLNGYTVAVIIHWLFTFSICSFGLLGNGIVIWILGFHMKRNRFTTFILNLAVADFGVLLCLLIFSPIYILGIFTDVLWKLFNHLVLIFFNFFFFFIYSTSQFLLAAISIERCVSVLFPIWHRCHRPTHLSTTVCALIWVISSLLFAIHFILRLTIWFNISYTLAYQCVANALLCLPLMAVSSLILFIKVCFKSQKNQRRRLLRTILLTLLLFLIFAFPLSAADFIYTFGIQSKLYGLLFDYSYMGAALNSSANPLIYFLVGRKWNSQSRVDMKSILQRVFKEEEETTESTV
ncbi:proto-oncogene Mas-like [Elgaria multicarinata webbii]|uniref:proto-oncogene Mas-like n=1 Tax=Elgaria multicarinata webbii TaxID=159646 RepID=UPI002FCCC50C